MPRAAFAHPHVWIIAQAVILYDAGGRISGIHHSWAFDEAYSAYAVQGLETGPDGKPTPEKLAELAKTNVDSLAEFNFFTLAKANGTKLAFADPTDDKLSYDKGILTLDFLLPLKAAAKADRAFLLDLYDPTFFVDFQIAPGQDAVRLEGAPKGCALNVTRPKPLEAAQSQNLSESFFAALSASSTYGAQFSNRVLVACP